MRRIKPKSTTGCKGGGQHKTAAAEEGVKHLENGYKISV